jgi:hypothetical protein
MLNPLLIQLFGRDVIDRLENAGLESDDAIAQLDPEELSARAGLAPEVSRRVVALAVELCGTSRAPRARRSGATRGRSAKTGTRTKRKTKNKQAPAERAAASLDHAAAPSEPADAGPDEEDPNLPALQQSAYENVTFVDEAGLIAWMGFASRTGPEGSLLSSVADGILEPAAPSETAPSETAPPQAKTSASPGEPASPRPETASTANSNTVLLEGSFWGFGGRPHGGVTVSPASSEESRPENDPDTSRSEPARPVPFHRRRSHDGH